MKQELRDGKHNEDLVVFTENELKSAIFEHSKEFFLGEDKFDIVRVENGVEGKKFYCINDQKEKLLFQNLDKQKKRNNVFEDVSKKFKFNSDKHVIPLNQNITFMEFSFPEWIDNYSFDPYFSFLRPPSVNS